jgi:hypothetical protein
VDNQDACGQRAGKRAPVCYAVIDAPPGERVPFVRMQAGASSGAGPADDIVCGAGREVRLQPPDRSSRPPTGGRRTGFPNASQGPLHGQRPGCASDPAAPMHRLRRRPGCADAPAAPATRLRRRPGCADAPAGPAIRLRL